MKTERFMDVCWVILAIALFVKLLSAGESDRDEPPADSVRVAVEYWHDADTPKKCTIHLPLGVRLYESDGLRASDYDAWEVGTRPGQTITADERAKGKRALSSLQAEFDELDLRVQLSTGSGRDKYGRPLGVFWLRRTSDQRWVRVADWIRANGCERGK